MEDYADLDHVPVNLVSPPDLKVAPPVVTRAQTLPLHVLSWENFERLCIRLVRLDGDIEYCRLYGTRGQKQHRIDLFARRTSSEKYRAYRRARGTGALHFEDGIGRQVKLELTDTLILKWLVKPVSFDPSYAWRSEFGAN